MSAEELANDAKMSESEKDVEGAVESVVEPQIASKTTTRLELWAFYVYYIVSSPYQLCLHKRS